MFNNGSFNVTGQITGTSDSFNSDLMLSNAAVTLSSSANYYGPTYLVAGSTLTTAVDQALPASTKVYIGGSNDTLSTTNTLNLGGKNLSIANLFSGGSGINQVVNTYSGKSSFAFTGTAASTFSGSIGGLFGASNKIDLTVSGGDVNLTDNNTYTGTTTITGGKIDLGATGSLSGTTNIAISSGSSLLLGSGGNANTVNTSASMSLGGTLSMGGTGGSTRTSSQTFGALTLTGNSTIDFSSLSGTSSLYFNSISQGTGTTYSLSVYNYTPGTTSLYDLNDSGSLDLSKISFYSDAGTSMIGTASLNGTQIVPVPEPGVVIAAFMLLGWLLVANRGMFLSPIRSRRRSS